MEKAVIIPVFNEARDVSNVLRKIRQYHDGRIIAIDDGSTDGSGDILAQSGEAGIISHETNEGYGKSLIDGFARAVEAGVDLVVTIDCDEQHEPAMIPQMFQMIGKLDVLSGSRYLEESGAHDAPPLQRREINMRITQVINQLTGYRLTDSFCGFKCYKTGALKRIELDEPGYAMPLQFWMRACAAGLAVGEIAVPRIYKNLDRSFGGGIDDPEIRLRYYMGVIEKEREKCQTSSS